MATTPTQPQLGELVEFESAIDGATYCGRITKTFDDIDATCIVRVVGFVPSGRYHAVGDEFPRTANQIRRAEHATNHRDGLVAFA